MPKVFKLDSHSTNSGFQSLNTIPIKMRFFDFPNIKCIRDSCKIHNNKLIKFENATSSNCYVCRTNYPHCNFSTYCHFSVIAFLLSASLSPQISNANRNTFSTKIQKISFKTIRFTFIHVHHHHIDVAIWNIFWNARTMHVYIHFVNQIPNEFQNPHYTPLNTQTEFRNSKKNSDEKALQYELVLSHDLQLYSFVFHSHLLF